MEYHKDIRSFDASATALAFPLGGIGTGNVSLGARGDLRDWEIFNLPAKGTTLPLTFFALRCQQAGLRASLPRLGRTGASAAYAVSWLSSAEGRRRFAALQRHDIPRAVSLRRHRIRGRELATLG